MRSPLLALLLVGACLEPAFALECLPNCEFPRGTFSVGTVVLDDGMRIVGKGPGQTTLIGTLLADGNASSGGTVRDLSLQDFTWQGEVSFHRVVDTTTRDVIFLDGPMTLDNSWSNQWFATQWRNTTLTLRHGSNAQLFDGCRWSPAAQQTDPVLVWEGDGVPGGTAGSTGTFIEPTVDGGTEHRGFRFTGFLIGPTIVGGHFELPRYAIETIGPMKGVNILGPYFVAKEGYTPMKLGDCDGTTILNPHGFAASNQPTTNLWECGANGHLLEVLGGSGSGQMVRP